jgi:hypothetical protein
MTLYESKAFAKKRLHRRKKYYAMPITVEDTKPYCYTYITYYSGERIRAKFMIDTGASHALLLDVNSSEDIDFPSTYIDSHLGRGLAGDITGKIGRLQSVELDQFKFDDVITTFPDKDNYLQSYDKVYRNGTLGGGILARFKVTFDFINGYVYLKKNKKYNKPFDYNMSGVVIKAKGLYLNSYEIVGVRENSAAARADIQAGDMIIRINNNAVHDLELNEINGVFNSKPNRTIRLDLKRDDKTIQRRFKLERII